MSWRRTLLVGLFAALVTVLSLVQLDSRTGMAGAIRRAELTDDTLREAATAFSARTQTDSYATRHRAVAQLLNWLVAVSQGSETSSDAVASARQYVKHDPDNLIAQLACATIEDLQPAPPGAAQPSAMDRFRAWKEAVNRAGSAPRATLYAAERTAQWHQELVRVVDRPAVAVSLAESYCPSRISSQFAGLPLIEGRLRGLRNQLEAEGHSAEVAESRRWMAQLTLGLIEADRDASTRLLCADLLARSLETEPPAAQALRRLRADYHAHACAAPVDRTDSGSRPAVHPATYRAAIGTMVAAVVFLLIAVGAGVVCSLSCLVAMMGQIVLRKVPSAPDARRRPRILSAALSLAPSMIAGGLLLPKIVNHWLYSQAWGIAVAGWLVALGAVVAVALAGWRTTLTAPRLNALAAPILGVLTLSILAIPASTVTQLCRGIEMRISLPLVLATVLLAVISVAILLSPARMRSIAAAASIVWCVNIAACFIVLQAHRVADHRYQRQIVADQFDELSARLGPDWQPKYLAASRDILAHVMSHDSP